MFYRSQRVLWRVFAPSAAECAEILPPFFGHFSAKPKDTQALAAPDATSWSCWPPDFRYKALFEKGGERLAWRFLAVRCLIELLENVVGNCRNHWYVAGASCQGTAHGACIVGGLGSWESASLFLVLKVIWIVNSETKWLQVPNNENKLWNTTYRLACSIYRLASSVKFPPGNLLVTAFQAWANPQVALARVAERSR